MTTAPTRTWTCSWNNVPSQATLDAQAKAVLYAWKENYKSAGWTCEGSSSRAAAGMDGTDRWASAANLVWAAAGAAHSWIVLKSPTNYPSSGKNVYVLLACSTGASSQHLINAGHASAPYTGGSTTADPTAPTNSRAYANKQILQATLANSKWHTLRNTVGDVLNFASVDNSGVALHANGCLQSAPTAESGDTFPVIAIMAYTSTGALTAALMQNTGHHAIFWTDGTVISVNVSGVAIPQMPTAPALNYFGLSGSNISNAYPRFPAFLHSGQSNKTAFRGTLVDVAMGPGGSTVPTGVTDPYSGTPVYALVGEFWVPCGGTVPQF